MESYYKIQFSLLAKYSSEEEESKSLSLSPNKFNQESPYYGFNEGIYEIHGNINYMRCDNSCTNKLFPSPDVLLSSFNKGELPLPKCPLCQGLARPHTLFFDESFNEDFYKRDTVLKKLEDMDCLVVIGTMLETNLASKIVGEAISKECLIIEINPTPIIECGNVLQLIGESEKIIPNVWKMARMKFFEYYDNEKMSKN